MKGFKYQIAMTVLLYKHKVDGDAEYSPVYFNSATKTLINFQYSIDKSFQEISYRIDNWINKGSGGIIESIDCEYLNIFLYSPLRGSKYIELPSGLRNSKKGLINVKNNDNKCSLWCLIRHLNIVETNPQKLTKEDEEMINNLHYPGIKFPVPKTDHCEIERHKNISINLFCYESGLSYPIYVSNQNFKDCMELLLMSNENKSHYVHVKDFNGFMCNKTKKYIFL